MFESSNEVAASNVKMSLISDSNWESLSVKTAADLHHKLKANWVRMNIERTSYLLLVIYIRTVSTNTIKRVSATFCFFKVSNSSHIFDERKCISLNPNWIFLKHKFFSTTFLHKFVIALSKVDILLLITYNMSGKVNTLIYTWHKFGASIFSWRAYSQEVLLFSLLLMQNAEQKYEAPFDRQVDLFVLARIWFGWGK